MEPCLKQARASLWELPPASPCVVATLALDEKAAFPRVCKVCVVFRGKNGAAENLPDQWGRGCYYRPFLANILQVCSPWTLNMEIQGLCKMFYAIFSLAFLLSFSSMVYGTLGKFNSRFEIPGLGFHGPFL